MNEVFGEDGIIGRPDIQVEFHDGIQTWNDSCAVAAEASLIRQFGIDMSEGEAAYISAQHGWYQPGGGTSPDVIGNLMEMNGIGTHTIRNAAISDLAQELSQGHGVIVGVRSDQLWDQGAGFELKNFLCKAFGFDTSEYLPADHAIVVTGIDLSDADNPMVLINDSGTQDGGAHAYSLERFMDAWENSDFYYTATNSALPSMTGHLGDSQGVGINWGKWIETGAETLTFLMTEDADFSSVVGMVAGNIYNELFAEESFVRTI